MVTSGTLTQDQPEMTNPHGDGRYIPILDGWRAVAIILVLMFHGLLHVNPNGNGHLQKLIDLSGRTGALGVLVFFCISGYLITQRLVAESRGTGIFSARNFYIKRVFRILPPLALYLLCIGALALLGVIHLVPRDWSAVCFLANYLQGSWHTTHFWSLSVEEHFYLFWPFCILLFGWRRAMWIGVALVVAVAVWRPWELHHHFGAERSAYLQHTDMRLDYIMMGSVLALALQFYPSLTNLL
jgi:peptidoglycan/LPS O-acetylase OafA/YrhL